MGETWKGRNAAYLLIGEETGGGLAGALETAEPRVLRRGEGREHVLCMQVREAGSQAVF